MLRRLIDCHTGHAGRRSRFGYLLGWTFAWAVWMGAASAAQAEKPPIGASAYGQWPIVRSWDSSLSNDGRYASFAIENQPVGSHTLVIRATYGSWRAEVVDGKNIGFSADSRKATVLKADHSLNILTLGSSGVDTRLNVESAQLASEGSHRWIVYRGMSPDKSLHVLDLATVGEQMIPYVDDFRFGPEGQVLVVQIQSESGNPVHIVKWVNLVGGSGSVFWRGSQPRNITIDRVSGQVAFLAADPNASATGESVWYYKPGMERAQKVFDPQSQRLDGGLNLGEVVQFVAAGSHLLVHLAQPSPPEQAMHGANVDVWSYKDSKLQSQQLKEVEEHHPPRTFAAVIRLSDHRLVQIEHGGDSAEFNDGETVFIHHQEGDAEFGEWLWNPAVRRTDSIASLADDGQIKHVVGVQGFGSLSPGGKYLIYYSPDQRNYFSYEVASGERRNITASIQADWTSYGNDHPDASYQVGGPRAWIKGDSGVFLYDQYDIWVVDPAGKHPAVNLTNGYGRRHHMVLTLVEQGRDTVIGRGARVMLTAFNRDTKDNGFFSKVLDQAGDPSSLTMGPYVYDLMDVGGARPIEAKNTTGYLVSRESATESKNLFFTRDFKTFTPLSDVHPERQYNWFTSELMEWKLPNGNLNQGVLYKPENFDPSKKYPVIFYYYEVLSHELHQFKVPEPVTGALDVPTFVSQGYLVFTPDIHYEIGHPMRSATNTVVSAAEYLSTMPWVDGTKLGLQGHSFGGMQTNYIVSHSRLFAAANAASGIDDFVSDYDSIAGDGASRQSMYEESQTRIGATLWQRPDLYIENSAIFQADQVTTPLLLFHTDKDGVCLFPQAVEFFTALRRLGKKVWMLEYEGYNHFLSEDSAAATDFTTRLMQFFDHYLKGAPPPKWMTQGIPARLKGIDTGLELDLSGREP